jgi:hypothetical protein
MNASAGSNDSMRGCGPVEMSYRQFQLERRRPSTGLSPAAGRRSTVEGQLRFQVCLTDKSSNLQIQPFHGKFTQSSYNLPRPAVLRNSIRPCRRSDNNNRRPLTHSVFLYLPDCETLPNPVCIQVCIMCAIFHAQLQGESSSEPAYINSCHAAGEDHDILRPLDDTSHQPVRREITCWELMLEPITWGRLYRSLRHVQSRVESSSKPICMNSRHAANDYHNGSRPLDDMSYQLVREGIPAKSLCWSLSYRLGCIKACVMNVSLPSHVQSRIE